MLLIFDAALPRGAVPILSKATVTRWILDPALPTKGPAFGVRQLHAHGHHPQWLFDKNQPKNPRWQVNNCTDPRARRVAFNEKQLGNRKGALFAKVASAAFSSIQRLDTPYLSTAATRVFTGARCIRSSMRAFSLRNSVRFRPWSWRLRGILMESGLVCWLLTSTS